MRKKRVFSALFLTIVLTLVFFTNCDSTGTGGGLFTGYASSCVGVNENEEVEIDPECTYADETSLELRINSEPDFYVQKVDGYHFDVGGDCDSAGFSQSIIFWDMMDVSGQLIMSSDPNKPGRLPAGSSAEVYVSSCVRGKFSLKVRAPAGGFLDQNYDLSVELIAVDENGKRYENADFARKKVFLHPL